MAGTASSPVAILTCRPNSHPFQERQVLVTEPIKIGRSVARARPAPNNAIFDCKVLSRNHALLWYENGTFYLQDTKSSNGTFINNQRLSKGSEESPPREAYSGDIVQFGVDVMENSRRVTHSCIIATIQIFHPDGREATNNHSSSFINAPGPGATVQSQELYQLAQYLQEALHREQMLENKLATLQRLVSSTQEATDNGWQALINEDRLLSRVELLENQLATYSKNQTEETLRQELTNLQEDKYNYESNSKKSLGRVLQEKLEAVRKLSDLERSLSNTEDECSHLRDMCETSQKELQELALKHDEQTQELTSLMEKLQDAEKAHLEEIESVEREKTELQARMEEMEKQEQQLQAQVESLQADNDFTKEQLANMKVKMENMKEVNSDTMGTIPELESQGCQVELVSLLDLQMLQGQAKDSDEESRSEDDEDVDMEGEQEEEKEMDTSEEKEGDSLSEEQLIASVDLSSSSTSSTLTSLSVSQTATLRISDDPMMATLTHAGQLPRDSPEAEELPRDSPESDNLSDHSSNEPGELTLDLLSQDELSSSPPDQAQFKETQKAADLYKSQLEETSQRLKKSQEIVDKMQGELDLAKSQIASHVAKISALEEKLQASDVNMSKIVNDAVADLTVQLTEMRKQAENGAAVSNQLKEQIRGLEVELAEQRRAEKLTSMPLGTPNGVEPTLSLANHAGKQEKEEPTAVTQGLQEEISRLKGLLEDSTKNSQMAQSQAQEYKGEVDQAREKAKKSCEEVTTVKVQLSEAQRLARQRAQEIETLQEQVKKADASSKDIKHQIITLRDRVADQQQEVKTVQSDNCKLRKQLQEAQQIGKQGKNETEQLRMRVKSLQEELEFEKTCRSEQATSVTSTHKEMRNQAAHNRAEFASLKEECASLRQRIQDTEIEMKTSRTENQALQREYSELQNSYIELEQMKDRLEDKQSTWKLNLTDAQKDADKTKQELVDARDEISSLKDRCSLCSEEMSTFKTQLEDMSEDYDQLAYRSTTLSHCSMIPLLLLLFGIVLAFYPTLSSITATTTLPET